ncbi:MAG TPA: VTT domain-containing protein [Anaerolineae bacterium]|nr:VTT domain-containing protein [Anaerolineae bacterium]HMR64210.1 VTT domain-containing protein [Anaerolineae bacterium]
MSLKNDFWPQRPTKRIDGFINQHASKLIALAFWLVVIGGYWWLTDQYHLTPEQKIKLVAGLFVDHIYGPVLFILFFALQPLVFFPSFLLGIAGGILYSPLEAVLYVTLGANGAAQVCYLVGRFFGRGMLQSNPAATEFIQRYLSRLRANTFETVLMLHLLFVPFDLVNYVVGFLRMDWRSFSLATVIGSLPGILMFVLFGRSLGSIDKLMAGAPDIDFFTLALSGVMLVAGIGLSQYLKRR